MSLSSTKRFYELCDEYGFYVIDEANIESHGMGYSLQTGGSLGNNPLYLPAHLDRLKDMVERDKTTRLSSHGLWGTRRGTVTVFMKLICG